MLKESAKSEYDRFSRCGVVRSEELGASDELWLSQKQPVQPEKTTPSKLPAKQSAAGKTPLQSKTPNLRAAQSVKNQRDTPAVQQENDVKAPTVQHRPKPLLPQVRGAWILPTTSSVVLSLQPILSARLRREPLIEDAVVFSAAPVAANSNVVPRNDVVNNVTFTTAPALSLFLPRDVIEDVEEPALFQPTRAFDLLEGISSAEPSKSPERQSSAANVLVAPHEVATSVANERTDDAATACANQCSPSAERSPPALKATMLQSPDTDVAPENRKSPLGPSPRALSTTVERSNADVAATSPSLRAPSEVQPELFDSKAKSASPVSVPVKSTPQLTQPVAARPPTVKTKAGGCCLVM